LLSSVVKTDFAFKLAEDITMNKIKNQFQGFKLILVLFILFGIATPVFAKSTECWVKIFDEPHYQGESVLLSGSTKLKDLSSVKGKNWDKKIESLIVGPKTQLILFENKNFKLTLKEMANHPVLMKSLGITKQDILEDSELIFNSNTKIHSFGEFNFFHKIRSLKIKCVD